MSVKDRMNVRDRMARAEDYVLGLMDDHERQRAERDMEVDPAFRDCVLELAVRLQRLHEAKARNPVRAADEAWNEIAARLAALPQMAGMPPVAAPAVRKRTVRVRPVGHGLHALGGRRGLAVALALAAVFALGWLSGRLM